MSIKNTVNKVLNIKDKNLSRLHINEIQTAAVKHAEKHIPDLMITSFNE